MHGVITALATPFNQDKIDYVSLGKLLNYQIDGGIKNIVIGGTTGEGGSLTNDEFSELIEKAVTEVKGRAGIIAALSSNITNKALGLAKIAKNKGAAGLLAVNPYYNKPTQAGIIAHYNELATIGLPIILYNIPGRTAGEISDSAIAKLATNSQIVAIKDCSGNVAKLYDVKNAANNKTLTINFLAGDDAAIITNNVMGGKGIISTISNLVPRTMNLIQANCDKKDYDMARQIYGRLYPLMKVLFIQSNPIPLKYILKMIGLIASEELRLPLLPLENEYKDKMRNTIKNIDLEEVKTIFKNII